MDLDLGMVVALETLRRMHARATAAGNEGAALNYEAALGALGRLLRGVPRQVDPKARLGPAGATEAA